MKFVVNENPMPAPRMTGKTIYYGKGKRYLEYKDYLAREIQLNFFAHKVNGSPVKILDHKEKYLSGHLTLKVDFYRATHKRVDIDNLLKMVMDLLQTAQVIANDDQIRTVYAHLEKGVSNPRFEVEIT